MAFWERLLPGKTERKGNCFVYDPDLQEPVLRRSICTGETTAGFRDRSGGHVKEVMLIRNEEDLALFMRRCGITEKPRILY